MADILLWPIQQGHHMPRSPKRALASRFRAMSLVFSNAAWWSTATIRRFKVDAVKPTSKSPIIELPQTGRP